MTTLTLEEFEQLLALGAQALDLRTLEAYQLSRVPGAIWVPAFAPEEQPISPCAADRLVVAYGGGDEQARIEAALGRLEALGFSDLRFFPGGFRAWVAGERPAEPPIKSYGCRVCSYGYYPHRGDPQQGFAPGILFEQLPANWRCPWCGAGKAKFEIVTPLPPKKPKPS